MQPPVNIIHTQTSVSLTCLLIFRVGYMHIIDYAFILLYKAIVINLYSYDTL